DDTHRIGFEPRLADRRGALLPVHDPARLFVIRLARSNRDHKRTRAAVSRGDHLGFRLEADPFVERHNQSVRNHRVRALQISANLGDVRQNLRPLVAPNALARVPRCPRDGREPRQQFPVHGKAVQYPPWPLPYLQGREPERHIIRVEHVTPPLRSDWPPPARASRLAETALEALIGHIEIVETTPPIPLCPAEQYDMHAELPAHRTGAA